MGTTPDPAWSPDGQMLAYYSDEDGVAQVWLWSRRTRTSRAVPNLVARPYYDGLAWQPDSSSLYARALPEGLTVDQANQNEYLDYSQSHQPVRLLPPPERPSSNERHSPSALLRITSLTDVVKIDTDSLRVTRIVLKTPIERFSLAPDGRRLALLTISFLFRGDESIRRPLV
jgi:Tol biopolymer transport system component